MLIVLLLLLIAAGAGLRLLRLLRVYDALQIAERIVFATSLGLGALALLMLAMGLLGFINLFTGLTVLAVLAGISYTAWHDIWPELRGAVASALQGLRYAPNLLLAAIIAFAVCTALVKALAPVATQDDLMYHLALPQRYIEAHSIGFYADSTYSGFPQLMEMLYTWGLLLGSDRISVLLAFSAGMLGPVAASLLARRFLVGDQHGIWRALPLLAAALYITMPLMGFVLRAANTDPAQASFDILSVYAFLLLTTTRNNGFAVLAGIMTGLSFSTKYYGFAIGLLLCLALILMWLASIRRKQASDAFLRSALLFSISAICITAPWLARDAIAVGNPVWPLAGGVFGGSYLAANIPAQSPESLLGSVPGLSPDKIWTGLQFMWQAMARGPAAIDNRVHEVALGFVLLPALLLLAFAKPSKILLWLGGFALGYWLIWAFFFSRTSARYLSTFYLLCAVLSAYALISLAARSKQPILQWALLAILGVAITWQTLVAAANLNYYIPTVFALDPGTESRYLDAYMEDNAVMRYIEEQTPASAVIYVWDGQPRGYRIPRPYVYARLVPLYSGFGQPPAQWRARLRDLGITHILVHDRDQLAPGQTAGQDPLGEAATLFRTQYFGEELYSVGDYALYTLKP